MLAVADTITLDDVNAVARSFLTFASDYGAERDVLARAGEEAGLWAEPGPSRCAAGRGLGRGAARLAGDARGRRRSGGRRRAPKELD
jgi:hypothetical protein